MKELFEINDIISKINLNNPIYRINEEEFNASLLQFGAFISIIKNKRVNQTLLLSLLLENKNIRECFKQISEIDDTRVLLYNLIIRFPILCKSKIIKNKIKELVNDRQRKAIL